MTFNNFGTIKNCSRKRGKICSLSGDFKERFHNVSLGRNDSLDIPEVPDLWWRNRYTTYRSINLDLSPSFLESYPLQRKVSLFYLWHFCSAETEIHIFLSILRRLKFFCRMKILSCRIKYWEQKLKQFFTITSMRC